ncbi:MAG TPA: hypothetical protein VFC92_02040 [Bacteroidales bacterium]|nr:hypothetical protein [Bacteroidales bacterium]
MRNPAFTLADDFHRDIPAVRVSFEKDFGLTFQLSLQKVMKK